MNPCYAPLLSENNHGHKTFLVIKLSLRYMAWQLNKLHEIRLMDLSIESRCYSWVNLIPFCKVKIAKTFIYLNDFHCENKLKFSFFICLFGAMTRSKAALVYAALICFSALLSSTPQVRFYLLPLSALVHPGCC